jgi:hypothetical protein
MLQPCIDELKDALAENSESNDALRREARKFRNAFKPAAEVVMTASAVAPIMFGDVNIVGLSRNFPRPTTFAIQAYKLMWPLDDERAYTYISPRKSTTGRSAASPTRTDILKKAVKSIFGENSWEEAKDACNQHSRDLTKKLIQ